MRLDDFLASIANSATAAQQIAAEYPKERLKRASEVREGQHELRNLKGKVEVAGTVWEFEVPEYNLEEAGVLGLDTLKVTLETDISSDDESGDLSIGLKRDLKGMLGKRSHATLEATFSFRDAPEAVHIIGDKVVEIIKSKTLGQIKPRGE